ncbi:hypothetical protein BGZ81_000657 [Podila clonocystis]|nr:hypothetical protein BGZ81_000657 [Podila clonocystis]
MNRSDRNIPKQRRRLSRDETEYLVDRFREERRPTSRDRAKFAEQLSLHPKTIQIWFQNRRAKMRKDESIARDLRIGREDDGGREDVKKSNGPQCGTSSVGSNSGSTENHYCGSGAETFVGFVGSPSSEDFECDPGWGNLAEDKRWSVEETRQEVITIIEDRSFTFCDGIYSPSPLEELSADSHLELGIGNFSAGLDVSTDFGNPATPPCLEYERAEIGTGKIGLGHLTPACLADINNHIPRHQMGLTLVPKDMLSIYVRDAASSWDLCS